MSRPKPTAVELFTIEESHGKPRLTAPRLSDVGTVPTAEERRRDHTPAGTFAHRNRAAANRGAKGAICSPLKDARRRCKDALSKAVEPSERDRLLGDAMALYAATRHDIGHTSVVVLSPAVRFAVNTVLAGHYTNAAAEAGFASEEGERLLGLAHACEQQAHRAMTAALAAAKALGSKAEPAGKAWVETEGESTE